MLTRPRRAALAPWLLAALLARAPDAFAQGPAGAPPAAAAPPASRDAALEQAERRYGDLEYNEAAQQARAALDAGGLSRDQVARAYRMLALSNAALKRDGPARAAFVTLLGIDPEYAFDTSLGPRATRAFEEAKAYWSSQAGRPSIEVEVAARPGAAGAIRVVTHNPAGFYKQVRAGYRYRRGEPYQARTLPPDEASVPLDAQRGAYTLEYYVVGLDEQGNVLFSHGSEVAPKAAFVDAPARPAGPAAPRGEEPGRPLTKSPWFWGGVVALVAAGVAAGFVASRDPTAASARPQIACGAGRCE